MTQPQALRDARRRKSRPSATRSQSLRRHQAVRRVMLGNALAMSHGIRSELVSRPDVQTEVALLYAAHPGLDPIADRRLVELSAMTNVQLVRCVLALEADGQTQILTAYHSKLAPLAERLERTLHERARERATQASRNGPTPLAEYAARPPRASGGGPV